MPKKHQKPTRYTYGNLRNFCVKTSRASGIGSPEKLLTLLRLHEQKLSQPNINSHDVQKSQISLGCFVKSRKNTPKILDFPKETFDQMSLLINIFIIVSWVFSNFARGNNSSTFLRFNCIYQFIIIVLYLPKRLNLQSLLPKKGPP